MRKLLTLVSLAMAALLLGACGSDGDTTAADETTSSASSSASASPSESTTPSESPSEAPPTSTAPSIPADAQPCSDVWSKGAKLPKDYRGCVEGAAYVKSDKLPCSSGQVIIRYDGRFWAVAGGTVQGSSGPLLKNKDYRKDVTICRA